MLLRDVFLYTSGYCAQMTDLNAPVKRNYFGRYNDVG